MPCSNELPPGLVEHLTDSQRPTAYYYFWAFGGACVLITCLVLLPRIRQFYQHAIHTRDEQDKALLPASYIACLSLITFPLIASFLKYMVFFSPISAYSVEFIMALYESIVLYSFTTLLIMYLGSKNLIVALTDAPKTKFYGAPPLGCCLRPCLRPSTVSKQDFRRLYYLIMQYCLALPLFMFVLLLRGYEGKDGILNVIKILKIISVMSCFYGLLALLKASSMLLRQHKITGKFWCIKGLIIVMVAPNIIIATFFHLPEQNSTYDDHTLVEAYGAMTSIVFLTGLSFVFLRFFKPEDALYAMHNAEKKDYTASKSLINVNSFRKEHIKCNEDESQDELVEISNLENNFKDNEHYEQQKIDQTDIALVIQA